ncbi:hypothetical protein EZV62_028286 [Acer yangbiense]|uniref:Mitochondrial protein n=1 Tax=Acer yangbiense TaxID=1000413 RepID=A0A5C7GP19_9ROSI|nr:hypothetical protein EZV62_028250 [Acer yangbiense]TXG46255.1 hypothetical protein EZV62_028286 [Acer yangbiense]
MVAKSLEKRVSKSFRLVRDRFTPRGAYTSRLSKFCSKTSSENLYREGFPAALQFFHTNLAARRCYWHNNRYTIVDIEVPNDSVDKSSWESSACYPRRTFDPLSESPSTRDSRITMADFRLCSTSRSHSQAGLYHYAHELNLSLSLPSHTSDWSLCVTTSHLSYTFDQGCHCEAIVKVHGVLPSSRWYSASSRRIQFHRVHVGDSGAVVTPFVQVATYATRNFATLGQRAPLLPKLRGHFAEFLRHGSLKRPSILYLFTCVGLGYGQFTGRIALPIRSFFLEVSTLLTMTTVATINRLATMAGRFRGKPAISDLGWPFTPSHKSSPYFATYVGSVLQGLLELSSTCSWLDRSVSGQIGRTRRFHLWKAPTPNGLSRCSHFLADPSCKRYAVRRVVPLSRVKAIRIRTRRVLLGRIEPWERIYRAITFFGQIFQPFHNYSSLRPFRISSKGAGFSIIQSTTNRMKPGEKEVNTLLRNEASSLFFFKPPIRSRSPLLTGSRLISLPLATQMFQFAKFEKSKERRLATELGYGFPIGDPWITDGISPWPFASESVLPSQCPGIHPMHSFRSCTQYTEHQPNLDETTSNYIPLFLTADRESLLFDRPSRKTDTFPKATPLPPTSDIPVGVKESGLIEPGLRVFLHHQQLLYPPKMEKTMFEPKMGIFDPPPNLDYNFVRQGEFTLKACFLAVAEKALTENSRKTCSNAHFLLMM